MANLFRQTGSSVSGFPTTSWSAPNGAFPTNERNDGSSYSFNSSTSTVTLPSSNLANGYLLIARIHVDITHNNRNTISGKFVQTSGTGTFQCTPATGFARNVSNKSNYINVWAFVDSPSALAQFQFQWEREIGDGNPAGSITQSSLDVTPLFYNDIGIFGGTDTSLYGGTTPNVVTIGNTFLSGSNITRSGNTITATKGLTETKNYIVLHAQFYENRGGRTQRWFGVNYDGIQQRSAQYCAYCRDTGTDYMGGGVIDVKQKVDGTSTTFQLTAYRGDGILNNQGGADSDGSTPFVGSQSLIIIELNDSAELIRTNGNVTDQNLNVNADLPIANLETFNVGSSFNSTNLSPTAIEVLANNEDGLFGANIGGASYNVASTVRIQSKLEVDNSGIIEPIFHGNYGRGNQGSTDTFGYSLNLTGFVFLEQNNQIKFLNTLTGNSGTFRGQATWMSAWGINLDTLTQSSVDVNVNANLQTANFSIFSVTVSTESNVDVNLNLQTANFTIQAVTVETQTNINPGVTLQIANFTTNTFAISTQENLNVNVGLQESNFSIFGFTIDAQINREVSVGLQTANFNIFPYQVEAFGNINVGIGLQAADFSIFSVVVSTEENVNVGINLVEADFTTQPLTIIANAETNVNLVEANFTLNSVIVSITSNVNQLVGLQIADFSIEPYNVITGGNVNVVVPLKILDFSIFNFTVDAVKNVSVGLNLQESNFSLFATSVSIDKNVNVGLQESNFSLQNIDVVANANTDINLLQSNFSLFSVTVETETNVNVGINLLEANFNTFPVTVDAIRNVVVQPNIQIANFSVFSYNVEAGGNINVVIQLISFDSSILPFGVTPGQSVDVNVDLLEFESSIQPFTVATTKNVNVDLDLLESNFSLFPISVDAKENINISIPTLDINILVFPYSVLVYKTIQSGQAKIFYVKPDLIKISYLKGDIYSIENKENNNLIKIKSKSFEKIKVEHEEQINYKVTNKDLTK